MPVEIEVLQEAQLTAVPLQMLLPLLPAGHRHLLIRAQQHAHPLLQCCQTVILCVAADLCMQPRHLFRLQQHACAQVAPALEGEQLAL
jgi:hypothetical protein